MNHKRLLATILGILFGLFFFYVVYGILVEKVNLRKYEEAFAQAQHPQDSSLIDSLSMKFEYYPATHIDDSIQFKSAYLVGEFRRYTGNWDDFKAFYDKKILEDGAVILVIPVEIHQNGRRTSLDIANGYPFSPFDADVMSAIQDYYGSRGLLQSLNETQEKLYLVYGVWSNDE